MSSYEDSIRHSLDLHNSIAEISRREARQRRTVAEAAQRQLTQATDAVQDIGNEVAYFENNLKADEEARIVIIGGPVGTLIFPSAISALGIDRIRFDGVDEQGCRVTVMQHISQLNVMLKAVQVEETTARRIGFHSDRDGDLIAS